MRFHAFVSVRAVNRFVAPAGTFLRSGRPTSIASRRQWQRTFGALPGQGLAQSFSERRDEESQGGRKDDKSLPSLSQPHSLPAAPLLASDVYPKGTEREGDSTSIARRPSGGGGGLYFDFDDELADTMKLESATELPKATDERPTKSEKGSEEKALESERETSPLSLATPPVLQPSTQPSPPSAVLEAAAPSFASNATIMQEALAPSSPDLAAKQPASLGFSTEQRSWRDVTTNLFKAYAKPNSQGQLELDPHNLLALLKAIGERPSQEKLQKMIESVDSDKDGAIMLDEFLAICDKNLGESHDLEEVELNFMVLDADHDGFLSVSDLQGLLSTMGDRISAEEARQLIAAADGNDDGRIDFEEFCSLLTSGSRSWRLRSAFRVIFVTGSPQSGKTTQCLKLVDKTGSIHVSAADLLKREVTAATELGKDIQKIISTGGVVKGSVVMALLKKFLAENPGRYILLDGFLKSKENITEFENTCGHAEMVLLFENPADRAVRLHVKDAAATGALSPADDPAVDSQERRLANYYKQVLPALEYFESKGIPIHCIDTAGTPEEVFQRIVTATPLARLLD